MVQFSQLAAIMLPVYIMIAIGFFWTRSNRTLDTDLIATLVNKIGLPCLIIAIFSRIEININETQKFVLASILVVLIGGVISAILVHLFKFFSSSYLPVMTFSLTGSLGLPLSLLSFGEKGLAYGLVFFTVTTIGTYRGGGATAAGNLSFDKLSREPVTWSIIVAVFLIWPGFSLPKWIIDTTWLLGAIAIPLQLLVTGSFLGRIESKFHYRTVIVSIVQLFVGFILGILVAELFHLSMTARAILILQATIPIIILNYIFSIIFKCESTDVAEMDYVSTIISALVLPLILAWLINNG